MFLSRPPLSRAGETDAFQPRRPVHFELDIVGIPAIGADAEKTWGETPETQWLGPGLNRNFPKARILLWDHLNTVERMVEPNRDANGRDSDAYQDAARKASRLRILEWADRLLEGLEDERAHVPVNRPIIFIAHSTGGIVLKEALCNGRSSALVRACLGITFFATPHHGSNILSLAACADTVKDRLGLKWPLGAGLRDQLAPQSAFLEFLNQRFSLAALGIEVWSYCEEDVLALEVHTELLPQKFRGKRRLQLADPVVDKRSAYISTVDNNVTIEEEVMLHVNANHVTLPRLDDDEDLQQEYIEELGKLTTEKNERDRRIHQRVINSIHDRAKISIFQFFNEVGRKLNPVNTLPPRHIALRDFLNANFDLGLAIDAQGSGSLPTIITNIAPAPTSTPPPDTIALPFAKTGKNETELTLPIAMDQTLSPFGPSSNENDASPARGRTDRLRVAEEMPVTRRLSHSRAMSRSRSRHRSVQIEAPHLPIRQAISGQRIDSILLSGSSGPPQREAPFFWIHTPYCVSSWVPQIMSAIAHKRQIPNLHWRLLSKEHWLTHHNRARHAASHAQYVRSHFQSVFAEQSAGSIVPGLPPPPSEEQIPDKVQFALFFPFLHWDTFKMQEKRSSLIKLRDKHDDPRYVDPDLLNGNNLEHMILWQYLLSDSPVHARRSLDQYGYPALRNTEVRDADQVLFKKTRTQSQEQVSSNRPQRRRLAKRLHFAKSSRHKSEHVHRQSERPPTVLSIDSLWLWILRQDTLVTFASKRQSAADEDPKMSKQADIVASVYRSARQDKLKDCYDLAALIVHKCVTALLDEADDPHLQIFHIFEEYLSDLTENYTNSFKMFRNLQRLELLEPSITDDGSDIDPTDTYASRKDLFHLFELRDITDELTTIRKLLTEQQKQVGSMHDEFQIHLKSVNKGHRALRQLVETLDALEVYIDTVDTMLKSSDAMQKSYEKLLDMKTAKVNVDEAHATRMQTEVSTQQSKTITVFTLVTIVFSPLSFMASIFGMNVSQWSGVSTNPDLRYVLKILGSVSLAVIVVAILIAFNRLTRAMVLWIWEKIEWVFINTMSLMGLGWLAESVHRGVARMSTRLPRTLSWAQSAPSTPKTISRSSTLMSAKPSTRLQSRVESSGASQPSLWHRQRRQRLAPDLEDEKLHENHDLNVGHEANGDAVPMRTSRTSTWGRSAPRVSMLFGAVRYDRQALRKMTEEPAPV